MVEGNKRYKLRRVGLKLAQLLPTRRKFVYFDVSSSAYIECARSSLFQTHYISQLEMRVGTKLEHFSWHT